MWPTTASLASLSTLASAGGLSFAQVGTTTTSFATARLMETWAHGQDIWDVAGRRRPLTHRLRHIAHLGVTTLGWTYVNRKLPAPSSAVAVLLDASMAWGISYAPRY